MSGRTPRGQSAGDRFEEGLIALLLGAMTLIQFANVIARELETNILWALEATVFLFAWLVLLGASYAVKHTFHIGIDILVMRFPRPTRRWITLVAVACCLAFSVLLLIGSWNYWWPFASTRTFYQVNDIPMPGFLAFLGDLMNEGEAYEKLPRFIPYAVLPISMLLLAVRFAQVGRRVWRGEQELIIESHEVEEIYEDRAQLDAAVGDIVKGSGAAPGASAAPGTSGASGVSGPRDGGAR